MPGRRNVKKQKKINARGVEHRGAKFAIAVDLFDRVSTDSTIVEQNASLPAFAAKCNRTKEEHNSYDSYNL